MTDPLRSSKRLRVLISAYACLPNHGSEPEIGWAFATTLAKNHDVWVLTRANGRERIEAGLAGKSIPGLHFIYYDPPEWFEWGMHGGVRMQLHSYCWQILVLPILRQACRDVGFDVAHHVTFAKYWAPCCLAWSKLPFVWGPVGGAELAPSSLLTSLSGRGRMAEWVKKTVSRLAEHDPLVRRAAKRSSVAFASTEETAVRLRKMGCGSVEVVSQAGIFAGKRLDEWPVPQNGAYCFISIGRLIAWKGFLLGLKAFLKCGLVDANYRIVGDGPDRNKMEMFVEENGLKDRVVFFGNLSFEETARKLSESDVLVHPSLHDSAGLVCLEAMRSGKPVLCLKSGGPALLVGDAAGICVDVGTESETVERLSDAMRTLASDSDLCQQYGRAGQRRVLDVFDWKMKVKQMSICYQSLVEKGSAV